MPKEIYQRGHKRWWVGKNWLWITKKPT